MYEKSPVRGGLCVAKARSPVTARSGGGGVNDLEHEEVCEVACYRGVFSVALDDFFAPPLVPWAPASDRQSRVRLRIGQTELQMGRCSLTD